MEKISRRRFLEIVGLTVTGLTLRPKDVLADSLLPYFAQPTLNTCGYACMAMLVAQVKNENVVDVYQRIQKYYSDRGCYDLTLGESALKDYMERNENIQVTSIEKRMNLKDMENCLENNGSTIVCVTSKYGPSDSKKNRANHWVLVDAIKNRLDGEYALVRDPLRTTDKFRTQVTYKLDSDMKDAGNGSILVPLNRFVSALGENYLFTDSLIGSGETDKRYYFVKQCRKTSLLK